MLLYTVLFADSASAEYCTTFLCVCVCQCVCHRRDISSFLHCARFWTIQTIYFLKGNDTRTSKTMFPGVKYTNTQIHKYTNTASVKDADSLNMCYIFVMVMVRGPQKQCSRVSDMQIHKYNYTNTQIQFGSNFQIDLTCAIFLKRLWYEDLKNNVPECVIQLHKYTNTTTQIHKYNYTNTQIQLHKYTNTQIQLHKYTN